MLYSVLTLGTQSVENCSFTSLNIYFYFLCILPNVEVARHRSSRINELDILLLCDASSLLGRKGWLYGI
jgi:hypothetical protein